MYTQRITMCALDHDTPVDMSWASLLSASKSPKLQSLRRPSSLKHNMCIISIDVENEYNGECNHATGSSRHTCNGRP